MKLETFLISVDGCKKAGERWVAAQSRTGFVGMIFKWLCMRTRITWLQPTDDLKFN